MGPLLLWGHLRKIHAGVPSRSLQVILALSSRYCDRSFLRHSRALQCCRPVVSRAVTLFYSTPPVGIVLPALSDDREAPASLGSPSQNPVWRPFTFITGNLGTALALLRPALPQTLARSSVLSAGCVSGSGALLQRSSWPIGIVLPALLVGDSSSFEALVSFSFWK